VNREGRSGAPRFARPVAHLTQVGLGRARFVLAVAAVASAAWALSGLVALADDDADRKIAESALPEARAILAQELLGHYDLVRLTVERIEELPERRALGHDYGLARVTLAFSTRRNATRHPGLNPSMFEPGSAMCQRGLYLHCGVPVGHVFEGRMELVLALDGQGSWRAVSPHWRSRRQYPLDGHLLLNGREPDGYVGFPQQRAL
jgi:hypothetical protein